MSTPSLDHRQPCNLEYYDNLRREYHILRQQRKQNENEARTETTNKDMYEINVDNILDRQHRGGKPLGGETIELRHLIAIMAFSFRSFTVPKTPEVIGTMMLAIQHFNSRNTEVVPAMPSDCNIKFTIEFFDSRAVPVEASRVLATQVLPRLDPDVDSIGDPVPTAVVGTTLSSVTIPLGILTGVHGIPMFAYGARSNEFLKNRDQYPLLARNLPSNSATAMATVDYLHQVVGSTHVAVLFQRDEYGVDFERVIREQALALDPPMHVASTPFEPCNIKTSEECQEGIQHSVQQLASLQYRHFVVVGTVITEKIMIAAYDHNIVGPGTLWVFPDQTGLHACGGKHRSPEDASKLRFALNGTVGLSLAPVGYIRGNPRYEAFKASWLKSFRTEEEIEFLKRKVPHHLTDTPGKVLYNVSEFEMPREPTTSMLLVYDATMSTALAACHAADKNKGGSPHFTGDAFYNALLNHTDYDGLYGRVVLDSELASRAKGSMPFVAGNFLADPIDDENSTSACLGFHVAYSYESDHEQQNNQTVSTSHWKKVDSHTFLYADGGTQPPDSLPPPDVRKLSHPAMRIGRGLSGALVCASLLLVLWTVHRREASVLRASQPVFLRMLCLGTFLTGLSGVFRSFQLHDDHFSEGFLDTACVTSEWSLETGFVISYIALYTKLRRVNRIFHAPPHARQVVREKDVFLPAAFLLLLQSTLITCWTMFDPLVYVRNATDTVDIYGRSVEYFGTCQSANGGIGVGMVCNRLLQLLRTTAVLCTLAEAYRARRITTHFSESHHIFIGLVLIFESILITLPLRIMGPPTSDNINGITTPIGCFVILIAIFWPKYSNANRKSLVSGISEAASFVSQTKRRRSSTAPGS